MTKIVSAALTAVILCAAALPATAADHAFTLHNNLTQPITKFKVKGGDVRGFKAIAPGQRITFTVSLPDGSCVARVSAFRQGGRTDGPRQHLRQGRLRAQPRRQRPEIPAALAGDARPLGPPHPCSIVSVPCSRSSIVCSGRLSLNSSSSGHETHSRDSPP